MSADIDEELVQALRRKKLFEELIQHPAWKELCAIGAKQIEGHLESLVAAPSEKEGQLDILNTYYRKGAVFGIKVILGTPAASILTAQDLTTNRQPRSYSNGERPLSDNRQPSLFDDDFGPDTRITELGGDE